MADSKNVARLKVFARRAAEARADGNDNDVLLNAGLTAAQLARIAAEQGADQATLDALAPLLDDDNPDGTFLKINMLCIGGGADSCFKATVEITIKAKCKSVG
jgi:hypothetical protein